MSKSKIVVIVIAVLIGVPSIFALGIFLARTVDQYRSNGSSSLDSRISSTSTSFGSLGKETRDGHLTEVNDVFFLNNYLFQASALDGFNEYKVEDNKLNYLKTVTPNSPEIPWQIRIDNDFLYLGTQFDGALIYDVHDPSNPTYVDKATFTHKINDALPDESMDTSGGFDVNNSIMAIAGSLGEVQFAQLTNGIHAQVVGKLKYDWNKGERISRILLHQNDAFLLSENQTLFVIDISKPDQPKQIASLRITESGDQLYRSYLLLRNTDLFVAYTDGSGQRADNSYLVSISVADPNKPTIENKLEIPLVPNDVIMKDGHIYLAYHNGPQTYKDTTKVQNGIMSVEVNDLGKMTVVHHNHLGNYDNVEKLATTNTNLVIFRGGSNDGSYQLAPL